MPRCKLLEYDEMNGLVGKLKIKHAYIIGDAAHGLGKENVLLLMTVTRSEGKIYVM
jgi:hypothetical protein